MPPDRPSTDAGSLPARYFDDLYGRAVDGDPWRFRTSPYEASKYAATLARLPRPRYASALEVGCSIGVFTRLLADRVDRLLGVDVAPVALRAAAEHCGDQPQVRFERADPLEAVPFGPFDLVVAAEVAYYWTPPDCRRALAHLADRLGPGGQLMLVHWRDPVPDYPQTGDEVHHLATTWAGALGLRHIGEWVDPQYRTDLWERPVEGARPASAPTGPR